MILCDVNIFVYAARRDTDEHRQISPWLEQSLNRGEAFGVSELVLSGFLRVVTHPRLFKFPSSLKEALSFVDVLQCHPNSVPVAPGPRHWSIFSELCQKANARGNLIPDAYLAALAIESGSEWISTDRNYARFPGLRWRHPLD